MKRTSVKWVLAMLFGVLIVSVGGVGNGRSGEQEPPSVELFVPYSASVDNGVTLEIIVQGPQKIRADAVCVNCGQRNNLSLSIAGQEMGWLGSGDARNAELANRFVVIPDGCRVVFKFPIRAHEVYLKERKILEKPITVRHACFPNTSAQFKISEKFEVVPLD